MNGMMTIQLPYEVTDEIVVQNLRESKNMIEEQLQEFYEKTSWMHEDDVSYSYQVLHSLGVIIEYYGGKETNEDEDPEMEEEMPSSAFNEEYMKAFLAAIDRT